MHNLCGCVLALMSLELEALVIQHLNIKRQFLTGRLECVYSVRTRPM